MRNKTESWQFLIFWVSILLNLFLVTMVMIGYYYYKVPFFTLIKKIVWNKEGFNWTAVTSLVALVGLFVTVIVQKLSIKADIISKERTRWLTNHKKLMSEYINNILLEVDNFFIFLNTEKSRNEYRKKHKNNKPSNYEEKLQEYNDKIRLLIERINEAKTQGSKCKILIELELKRSNSENIIFLDSVEKVQKSAKNVIEESSKYDFKKKKELYELLSYKIFISDLKSLKDIASDYYSNVWIAIKNGE